MQSNPRLNDRQPFSLVASLCVLGALLMVPLNLCAAIADRSIPPAATNPTGGQSILWSELGAKATAQYSGDDLAVFADQNGTVRLSCVFQKLAGEVTPNGLWLTSTVKAAAASRFQLVATRVGRSGGAMMALAECGTVHCEPGQARYVRSGLVEEYSVSVDGVRQDFVVAEPPDGAGDLRVDLALTGARAETAPDGARLVLHESGRKLAYSRLRVVDACGRELGARIEVAADDRLAVAVADAAAVYPVRIDPTFSDENWVSLGGVPGLTGTVMAAVVDSTGTLYVGGYFTGAGAVVANNIAKWDGSAWSPLDSGTGTSGGFWASAGVRALALSGGDLYVGGDFTTAGGVSANRIAKWDGSAWSPLGSGMNGTVHAIAVSGTDLYAGGNFTTAGGVSANRIAKWDGSAWSALGSGMNKYVSALVVSGTDLYAGGGFTTAGGVSASRIAKWNGSAWSALGSGVWDAYIVDSSVSALVVLGTDLYAAGDFNRAGGLRAYGIAKWDGSAWSALDSDMSDVSALAASGTELYACGRWTDGGSRLARWNGTTWSALAPGMSVGALAVSGTDVYAGGAFTMAGVTTTGGVRANNIAKWNGTAWSALGSGNDGHVYALAVSGTDVYAGGDFTTAGGVSANRIAKWNGSAWSALGSGLDNDPVNGWPSVSALAVSGTDLYAGGGFTTAGGVSAYYIAKWDGTAWSALGSGMDSSVEALAVSGTDLYAGGTFTVAGGVSANYVAKWDGSAWSALSSGMDGPVGALEVSGTDLHAGGFFTMAGEVLANNIAKWNGSAWSSLGSGMSGAVSALAVSGTDLYAGGYFTTAGGISANRIAKWNGSAWSSLGSGMNSAVSALAVSGTDLYAGGYFTMAGGKVSGYAAKAVLPGLEATTTTLDSSANPSTYGSIVTFTAAVLPGAAGGTVTFKDGAAMLGIATLTGGTASFGTSALSVGSHSITAQYTGDANYEPSTAPALNQVVNPPANHDPMAGPDILATSRDTPVTVAVSKFTANDTDPDGDPLAISDVGATSAQGGTAAFSDANITYTPPRSYVGLDAFTYTVTDGRGGSAPGTVAVTVRDPDAVSQNQSGIVVAGNEVTLTFRGLPHRTYTIHYTESLIPPVAWVPLNQATANGRGVLTYIDTLPSGSLQRFYRTTYP